MPDVLNMVFEDAHDDLLEGIELGAKGPGLEQGRSSYPPALGALAAASPNCPYNYNNSRLQLALSASCSGPCMELNASSPPAPPPALPGDGAQEIAGNTRINRQPEQKLCPQPTAGRGGAADRQAPSHSGPAAPAARGSVEGA